MDFEITNYMAIVIMIALAVGTGLFIITASYIFSPRYKSKAKDMPYESGFIPVKDARNKFNIRFCVIAILFLIFDVEAVFIFPWAIFYKDAITSFSAILILGEMFIFLGVLLFGLIYAYARGGLEWD